MPTPSAQQEPTMEEILASIRRIISEDAEPGKTAPATASTGTSDVLELTNVVHDDGTLGGAADQPPEPRRRPTPPPQRTEPIHREPPPEPRVARRAAAPEPRPMRNQSDLDMVEKDDRDGILSSQATSAVTNAFGMLQRERDVSVGGAGVQLEDIVTQLMKPMLAAWLEEHLPEIVERVVQQEVERAARNSGGTGRRR